MDNSRIRVVVAGGPKCGKSTIASKLQCTHVWRTDFLLETLFERYAPGALHGLATEVRTWLHRPGPWVIEGVPTILAIEYWRNMYATKPCDILYWMDIPKQVQNDRQAKLHRHVAAAFDNLEPWLRATGTRIIKNP